MGWTELIHGAWSPKRVATGSVRVHDYLPPPNEIRFEPRFDPEISPGKVTLLIGCNRPPPGSRRIQNPSPALIKLRGFQFCEDQMVALSQSDIVNCPPQFEIFNGTFQQLSSENATARSVDETINNMSKVTRFAKPLLWFPRELEKLDASAPYPKKRNVTTWTLSYNSQSDPFALAVGTKRMDGTSTTHFTLPMKPLFPTYTWWGTGDLDTLMKLVELDHSFSHKLMEAASSRVDPVKRIYKVLGDRAINEK
ncbi:hypothetical protein NW755_012341 [Fusarium falciforme]|uniref:Uncharacterized protein n=1 Tax=Fusarium falciforme TaxID=195108 RepID=A0A9W8QW46_9HYPO|nr:hypothetical protein NW755_012341 [Fusarium falciforme]